MGQYWKPVCLDMHQGIDMHYYNEGLKLMEHSYKHTPVMRVVCRLLMEGQPWHKKHFAWVGDYADDSTMMLTEHCDACLEKETNYDCPDYLRKVVGECNGTYRSFYDCIDIKPKVPTKKQLPDRYYLVNHTKRCFVDMDKCPIQETYSTEGKDFKLIIHPLSLLTAVSNGLGGGDYTGSNMDMVGHWAGDVISVSLEKPAEDSFEEIIPNFLEER